MEGLNEAVDYVKTELMPDYDYESERPAKTHHTSSEHPKQNEEKTQANTSIENTSSESTPTSTPQIGDDEQIDWN